VFSPSTCARGKCATLPKDIGTMCGKIRKVSYSARLAVRCTTAADHNNYRFIREFSSWAVMIYLLHSGAPIWSRPNCLPQTLCSRKLVRFMKNNASHAIDGASAC